MKVNNNKNDLDKSASDTPTTSLSGSPTEIVKPIDTLMAEKFKIIDTSTPLAMVKPVDIPSSVPIDLTREAEDLIKDKLKEMKLLLPLNYLT